MALDSALTLLRPAPGSADPLGAAEAPGAEEPFSAKDALGAADVLGAAEGAACSEWPGVDSRLHSRAAVARAPSKIIPDSRSVFTGAS